ncbi:hypothetical protein GQ457_13G029870 [Hibiscus cannabinus]
MKMKEMKERMERLVVLPFTAGCSSQASVASEKVPRGNQTTPNPTGKEVVGERWFSSKGRTKNSLGWLTLRNPTFPVGYKVWSGLLREEPCTCYNHGDLGFGHGKRMAFGRKMVRSKRQPFRVDVWVWCHVFLIGVVFFCCYRFSSGKFKKP